MARVVEDLLPGGQQAHRGAERFAGAGVAGVPGVGAAGDLEPEPVAAGEAVRGGPERERALIVPSGCGPVRLAKVMSVSGREGSLLWPYSQRPG